MVARRVLAALRTRIARPLVHGVRRPYVLTAIAKASEVRLLGYRIRTDPDVFHPSYFSSSLILAGQIRELDLRGRRFLDMGTGTGLICHRGRGTRGVGDGVRSQPARRYPRERERRSKRRARRGSGIGSVRRARGQAVRYHFLQRSFLRSRAEEPHRGRLLCGSEPRDDSPLRRGVPRPPRDEWSCRDHILGGVRRGSSAPCLHGKGSFQGEGPSHRRLLEDFHTRGFGGRRTSGRRARLDDGRKKGQRRC